MKEHDIEQLLRAVDFGQHWISGEDDGGSPSQSHPRDKQPAFVRDVAERKQAEEYAERTCHENHEHADEQAHSRDVEHFVRVDQQSQGDEDDNLEQPGQSVHEGADFFPESQPGISEDDSHDVHRQVSVSFQLVGNGEGDEQAGLIGGWDRASCSTG